MAFITPQFKAIRFTRWQDNFGVRVSDWSNNPELQAILDRARKEPQPFWGELFWASDAQSTLLNRRAPVIRDGRFIGMLVTVVSLADLSRYLREADQRSGKLHSFLLYGSDHVLAHPNMADGKYERSDRFPIPSLSQIGDPVLANLWNEKLRRPGIPLSVRTQGQLLDMDDGTYTVVYRVIDGYADLPLRAGSYTRLDGDFGVEFQRLILAGFIGGVVLLIAVGAALWLGRRMAEPIRGLAAAAESVRDLRLDPAPTVDRSSLAELDDAATAFNAMLSGMKWFETYVPRALVRSLLADGDESVIASAERDVTVLFTDIRNFTGLAESMSASETADFLNEHFSLIDRCVEAEAGTIDKYIGDSVMVFWGAPLPVDDHALRACRAALAIRAAIARANAAAAADGAPILRMGIGIHSGRVLAGNIGAVGRVNYTLVGDAVNLAQRLEQLTKPLAEPVDAVTILISAQVAAAVRPVLKIEPCGTHEVRGRGATIDVYRLK
jgi:class 3 adenylate cyclase